jgi:hypothetical protein
LPDHIRVTIAIEIAHTDNTPGVTGGEVHCAYRIIPINVARSEPVMEWIDNRRQVLDRLSSRL